MCHGMFMIPVFKPLISLREIEASTNALKLGWLGMGSFVAEFEK
jgi:dTDP-4-amino-4,6-dideoxygalactose transaminase